MLEVIMSLSQFTTVMWTCSGRVRSRHGNDFWSVVPTTMFRCLDGWVYINVVPGFWDPFTICIDRPDLTLDPRFRTNGLRMENRDALHEIIGEAFMQWTRDEIQARAERARIPLGAILSFSEVLDDPHLRARNMWQQIHYNDGDCVTSPRIPYVMDAIERRDLTLTEPTDGEDG